VGSLGQSLALDKWRAIALLFAGEMHNLLNGHTIWYDKPIERKAKGVDELCGKAKLSSLDAVCALCLSTVQNAPYQ